MTMKDKIKHAIYLARRVQSVAKSLEYDAKDYDCYFPLTYAAELKSLADDYLKMVQS